MLSLDYPFLQGNWDLTWLFVAYFAMVVLDYRSKMTYIGWPKGYLECPISGTMP